MSMTPGVSLQAVIEAPRRLDELSTARVLGEAAEAVHKAQKGGLPLGTLMPQAIVLAASGISLAPPATPSIAYSAPEKLRGQAGDRRSDVFSLGVVLWEALAHERLFDAPTDDARKAAVLEREIQAPSELNANVPAELDAIVKKALSREPANRYQSAKVMAAEISAVLDDAGYPDSNDEIAKYLGVAFPEGAPVAASSIGAAIAAKLASAPSGPAPAASAPPASPDPKLTRQQLNATMHGFAPIREPAKPEPAKPEPAKPEPVAATPEPVAATPEPVAATPEPAPPIVATPAPAAPKLDPGKTIPAGSGISAVEIAKVDPVPPDPKKTMPGGSGLSLPDLVKAEAAKQTAAKPAPEPSTPSSGLSPSAFAKPTPGAPPPAILDAPPAMPAPVSAQSPLMTQAPADVMTTLVDPPKPQAPADVMTTLVDPPKPQALIVEEAPKAKPSLSNAETLATPALVPAPSAGIAGLPAMPPGAQRSFDDDFATNSGAKAFIEPPAPAPPPAAVTAIPLGTSSSQSTEAAVDPSAAVSLPRRSRPGTDKGKDVLADWGWSTDSHAAIDDGGQYEEAPNAGRKRLLIAAGSALGAIVLIVVIAVAASGGGDKKSEPSEEPVIADTSRKATDPDPVAKPTDPQGTQPAIDTADQPATGEPVAAPPRPEDDPAAIEAATAEAARAETARLEAEKAEAAKAETAKLEAEKAEMAAAKMAAARSEAEKAELAKAEAARIKAEKAAAAKAETARITAEKADAARLKADAARAAREEAAIAKAATAEAAKVEAARIKAEKAEKAEQARLAKVEPAKKDPKKEPKLAKTAKPIDPYAEKPVEKPKADPAAAYKTGFQQYVRGETNAALTTFKGSLAANPGYPPTWRGLGMVYEKLGQKAQAKKSFTRYLQLSPNASDADQIRSRMERLGS